MTCQPRLQSCKSVRRSFKISISGTNVDACVEEAKEDGREILCYRESLCTITRRRF